MEQRTSEWYLARKGKFTASEIYNLLTTSKKKDETFGETALTYIKGKVSEYLMQEDVFIEMQDLAFSNTATRWGEQYEPEARQLYSELTGIEVEETGFIPYSRHSGGSPDGLWKNGQGLIEIKCPFNPSKHIEFMMMKTQDDLKEANKQYYWQCMSNMLFAGCSYIDFVSYDPRLSELLKMKILRLEANPEDLTLLSCKIQLASERMEQMLSELTRIGIEQFTALSKAS